MKMPKTVALFILLAVTPIASFAASMGDTYVIPVAAHTSGATGETWTSEASFFNPASDPLLLDLALVDSTGASRSVASGVTVAANATVTLRDIIGAAGGSGALIVAGNHPFAITSRAVATSARGTFNESIVPATEFIDAVTHDAFLPGLAANGATRSNIGFFAAADRGADMTVTITLFGPAGTQLGTRSFTVPGGGMTQVQISTQTLTAASFGEGSARVSITGGNGIATAYGSVVDNATGEGVFIAGTTGVAAPSSAAAALRTHFTFW